MKIRNILTETIKSKKGKIILPFFVLGLCGITIEVLFRAMTGEMGNYSNLSYLSFCGYSSVWMIIVYGFGGIALTILNEIPKFYNLKMVYQMFLGGGVIIIVEFMFGVIFNIVLKLNLWNYEYFSILGQINLVNSALWILATPFFIWLCDFIGWALYRENEDWHYEVWQNYADIINGR